MVETDPIDAAIAYMNAQSKLLELAQKRIEQLNGRWEKAKRALPAALNGALEGADNGLANAARAALAEALEELEKD